MTEREKMIEIIAPFVSAYGEDEVIADALIAANIGDVTELKEQVECAKRILQIPTLPNGKTDLSYFEYKRERIQDIARQRDEYKHRAEVAEERLKKLKKTEGDLTVEEEINILKNLVEEAKHRSFVFEKELVKYKMAFDNTIKAFHETLSVLFPDTKINLDEWKKDNLANAEKELAEEGKK